MHPPPPPHEKSWLRACSCSDSIASLTSFLICSLFMFLTLRKDIIFAVWRFTFGFRKTYSNTIRWSLSPKSVTPANGVLSGLLVRITSTSVWDVGVTLVGSFIKQVRSNTSSKSINILPSVLKFRLSLSMFRSPSVMMVCLCERAPPPPFRPAAVISN